LRSRGALVWAARNTCGATLTRLAANIGAMKGATTLETTLSPRSIDQTTQRGLNVGRYEGCPTSRLTLSPDHSTKSAVEFLFWTLVLAVTWCFAGYPLYIIALARFRPRPIRPATPFWPSVTVIVAIRNERDNLPRRLANLLAQEYPPERLDIVVVCNGSVDGSEEIARQWVRSEPRVRVLTSPAERGKAGALSMAAAHTAAEVILFADARQTFARDAVARIVEPFSDPDVGAVTGRLEVRRADVASVEGVRMYWGLESRLRDAEGRSGSVIGATGAIYGIRRSLFPDMPPNLILDDVYIPLRIAMLGHRVVMAPRAVAFDVPSSDQKAEYARKRRTMVGNIQLIGVIPGLLSPFRNPLFMRFVSHKLLRLLTPFCFVALLFLSALLPGWAYRLFFAAELGFYLLGVVGLWVGVAALSVPAAFVLMQAAILSAVWRWNDDATRVWTQPALSGAIRSASPPS
jgi:cellulose synthase/poly-beta-1,6-N-acetylglucosamine synthase-like glycosyltransferase